MTGPKPDLRLRPFLSRFSLNPDPTGEFMRRVTPRLRTAVVAGVVGVTTAAGLAALTIPARADASFSFSRLAGNDRFASAGAIDQAAYPSGAPSATTLLADGLSAHAPDALAASGLEGVAGVGLLTTDSSNTVPSSTLAALNANKVHNISVLGGTASVSQAQINQLKADGFNVTANFQGTTRYQTMQMIDNSIKPNQVGTDAAGNPTAILASGDPAHYVDALSAGALAYAKKFPIILTNSTGTTLQPEASQVISSLGIKDLIVVGGTGSIPASQYNPKPSGVTQVEVEFGSDRSATSVALADYAIGQSWLKATHMDLARGDDGADALAGSAFGGVNGFPTVITDAPTSEGSAPNFATEHASTLTGTSYIFGGTAAVPDTQASDIANDAGAAKPATSGAIAPASGQHVNSVSATAFTQGGLSYTYKNSDTYQVMSPGSSGSSCASSSYAVFQAALTQDDTVTGTYNPSGASTFCLNDTAPNPPSTTSATPNTTSGGVTVTWSDPSTAIGDGVTGYDIYRALASPPALSGFPYTCSAAYTNAPGSSPQVPPTAANGYSLLANVPVGSGNSGSYTYQDTSATPGSGSTANEYCYAISSVAVAASGANQIGSATPIGANQLQAANPAPVAPKTVAAPAITSVAGQGHTITITYNEAVNPATVASDGSDFVLSTVTYSPANAPHTIQAFVSSAGSGNQVILDIDFGTVGSTFQVTQQSGSDGNTVCSSGSTTNCASATSAAVSGTSTTAGTAPTITGVSGSFVGQTITVTYNEPIDCATVDTGGSQYVLTAGGSSITAKKAQCGSGSTTPATATTVTLSTLSGPLVSGGTVTVQYSPLSGSASNLGIVSSATGGGEPLPDPTAAKSGPVT